MNFRIKEVKVPLKSEEITIYYPQVERTYIDKKGFFWWRKDIKTDIWCNLYRSNHPSKGKDVIYSVRDSESLSFLDLEIISCNSIQDAKVVLIDYEQQMIGDAKKFYSKNAVKWIDDRYVKYHKAE